MEKKFENGTYQLQDKDGKQHKRRVNGGRLKICFAHLMVAHKDADHEEGVDEFVKETKEEYWNLISLFAPLLNINVIAKEWGY